MLVIEIEYEQANGEETTVRVECGSGRLPTAEVVRGALSVVPDDAIVYTVRLDGDPIF